MQPVSRVLKGAVRQDVRPVSVRRAVSTAVVVRVEWLCRFRRCGVVTVLVVCVGLWVAAVFCVRSRRIHFADVLRIRLSLSG